MNKLKTYVAESIEELKDKVTWPTFKELQGSSVLVLIASFLIAAIVYLMDASFGSILDFVYNSIN